MKIDTDALKKQVILHLPYLLFLLVFAKLGEAVRLAPGADASQILVERKMSSRGTPNLRIPRPTARSFM